MLFVPHCGCTEGGDVVSVQFAFPLKTVVGVDRRLVVKLGEDSHHSDFAMSILTLAQLLAFPCTDVW